MRRLVTKTVVKKGVRNVQTRLQSLKPREEEKEEALTKFTNPTQLMQISFVIISAMSIWWESLRSGICCQNVMGIRPTVFSYFVLSYLLLLLLLLSYLFFGFFFGGWGEEIYSGSLKEVCSWSNKYMSRWVN